jgi:peptidoglycan/LPS O-acetylase OafA/YrhL
MAMWFIAQAWARSGGHGGVQHRGSGDYYPSDSETGFALMVGAIVIWIAWLLFEFFKMYRRTRGRPTARATGRSAAASLPLDDLRSRLSDRVRSINSEDA